MKPTLLFFLAILTLNFAKAQHVNDLFVTNYISLPVPQDYEGELKYLDTTDTIAVRKAGAVKHDYTYLASFPNLVSTVTLYEDDGKGGLTLLGNSLSVKRSKYVVIYDYTQTQTIHVTDSGTLSYYALIGISVRMVAHITTKSGGINLVNLYGLGLEASRGKVSGSLEVRSNGVNSQQINAVIPVTADLSQASIANALQAVATIKSHIYDSTTRITPQFLAFGVTGNNEAGNAQEKKLDINQVSRKVKEYKFQ